MSQAPTPKPKKPVPSRVLDPAKDVAMSDVPPPPSRVLDPAADVAMTDAKPKKLSGTPISTQTDVLTPTDYAPKPRSKRLQHVATTGAVAASVQTSIHVRPKSTQTDPDAQPPYNPPPLPHSAPPSPPAARAHSSKVGDKPKKKIIIPEPAYYPAMPPGLAPAGKPSSSSVNDQQPHVVVHLPPLVPRKPKRPADEIAVEDLRHNAAMRYEYDLAEPGDGPDYNDIPMLPA
eukprot:TRINITY_DN32358_c0_g1_i1.p1 TRINITY_DN32358_c0_g1~~TRINITY_DN32358_c0_g1_i1.p1  ORF type:complete len:259 (+),score=17.00 TRINITY_DN32358_c0_g1_i1:85-777(+)